MSESIVELDGKHAIALSPERTSPLQPSPQHNSSNTSQSSSHSSHKDTGLSHLRRFSFFTLLLGSSIIIYCVYQMSTYKSSLVEMKVSDIIQISYQSIYSKKGILMYMMIGVFVMMQGTSALRSSMYHSSKLAIMHYRRFNSFLLLIGILSFIKIYIAASISSDILTNIKQNLLLIPTMPQNQESSLHLCFYPPSNGTGNSTHFTHVYRQISIQIIVMQGNDTALVLSIDPKKPLSNRSCADSSDYLVDVEETWDEVHSHQLRNGIAWILAYVISFLALSYIAIVINLMNLQYTGFRNAEQK